VILIAAVCEVCQQENDRSDEDREHDSAAGAGLLRDHRELLRDSHHIGFGMLNIADEAGSDFLGIETQEGCIAAKERNQVEPIRDQVVTVGLDHFDVMRRQMSLVRNLFASEALAFAGFGDHVAERRFRLGAVGDGFRSLIFRFGCFVGHLRSISPRQSYSRMRPNPSGSIPLPLIFYTGLEAGGCGRRRGEGAIVERELFSLASDNNRRGF